MSEFSKIWHFWYPNLYSEVSFSAKIVQGRKTPKNNDSISTFSGGLDSAFINYLIAKGVDNPLNLKLKKAVLVHGADVPLSDEIGFDTIRAQIQEMADDLNIELIPVKTNVKESLIHWGHSHGSLFVGIMSFFSKTISHAVTSDYSYASFHFPHGFNPFTDKYFSSDEFEFHLEGIGYSRTERAAVIKNWRKALSNLHVCYEGIDNAHNCGCCEKCIRTKLNFKAVGVDHLDCMPFDLNVSQLTKNNLVYEPITLSFYKDILSYGIKNRTLSQDWILALNSQIEKWEKLTSPNRSIILNLYSVLILIYRKLNLRYKFLLKNKP